MAKIKKPKVIVVIPALNEEGTIAEVIRGVKKYVDSVVLVNDGSSDKTGKIAKELGAIVVSHKGSEGYDKSIDDGFKMASKMGAGIILTFDADGQHNPQNIPSIIRPIVRNEADLVVGRRPYKARITEYLFAFIAKRKAGIDDPLCGLKAYDINLYKDVGYFDRKSSIGTELMFNAVRRGYKIKQIDIALDKRKDTPRFGRSLKANWKIFKAIIKTLFI